MSKKKKKKCNECKDTCEKETEECDTNAGVFDKVCDDDDQDFDWSENSW